MSEPRPVRGGHSGSSKVSTMLQHPQMRYRWESELLDRLTLNFRYKNKKYIPVHARFNKEVDVKFPSLAHLYNEWYNAYVNVTAYPRLMVRLEDIIFRADQVVPKICECFGGTWSRDGVHHRAKAANRNPGIDINSPTSGLLGSIIKYGNRTLRRKYYQRIQFEAAKEILDPRLMELFGYSFEDP